MNTQVTTCQTCHGTKWHNGALCYACEIPLATAKAVVLERARVGSSTVQESLDALAEFEGRDKRPTCFEAYALTELSDEDRVKLQRIQSRSRCRIIESRLEYLGRQKLALTKMAWDEHAEEQAAAIREQTAQLESEHLALRQILALPDAEMLEYLNVMLRERGAA